MDVLDKKTALDDEVTQPSYSGGPDDPFEPLKIVDSIGCGPGMYFGHALKYMQRAGKKGAHLDPAAAATQERSDLSKALWYLSTAIALGYSVPVPLPLERAEEVATAWAGPRPHEPSNVRLLHIAISRTLRGHIASAEAPLAQYVERRKQALGP